MSRLTFFRSIFAVLVVTAAPVLAQDAWMPPVTSFQLPDAEKEFRTAVAAATSLTIERGPLNREPGDVRRVVLVTAYGRKIQNIARMVAMGQSPESTVGPADGNDTYRLTFFDGKTPTVVLTVQTMLDGNDVIVSWNGGPAYRLSRASAPRFGGFLNQLGQGNPGRRVWR